MKVAHIHCTDLVVSIQSGNIASGQIGGFHIASGAVQSGHIASGQIGGFHIASGAVQSGHIASGQIGGFHIASGAVTSGRIASGQIGQAHLASGAVQSGQIGSGTPVTFSRNVFDELPCGQAISGVIAVCFNSGGGNIVPAERGSGLRLPAIGVSTTNAASGSVVQFVRLGKVLSAASGTILSGFVGSLLYVGSGGLIVNVSGFNNTGFGPGSLGQAGMSGTMVQRIGVAISGGIYVMPEIAPSSGLLSGLLSQF